MQEDHRDATSRGGKAGEDNFGGRQGRACGWSEGESTPTVGHCVTLRDEELDRLPGRETDRDGSLLGNKGGEYPRWPASPSTL